MSIFKKKSGDAAVAGKSDLDAKAAALASEPDEGSKIAWMLKTVP